MKYVYLLGGGILVSITHVLIVWRHRHAKRYSLSEYAMQTTGTHAVYFVAHLITEILFLAFSYQFFVVEHQLYFVHYLNIAFVFFDFAQALLPSRGRTEKIHFLSAYISWFCFLLGGVAALVKIPIAQPFYAISVLLLVPILGMFLYMHINRTKLWPYQLLIVPLFVLYMLTLSVGAL
jgi:hypothetical protein